MLNTPAREMVKPIPKAMKNDETRPIPRIFKERENNIMITTPGQGTMPTARATGRILL